MVVITDGSGNDGNDSIGSSGGIEVKVEVKTEEDVDGGDNGGDDENENGDGDDHGDQDDDYDVEGDAAKVDPPSPASREFRNLLIATLLETQDEDVDSGDVDDDGDGDDNNNRVQLYSCKALREFVIFKFAL